MATVDRRSSRKWLVLLKWLKKVSYVAAPMVGVTVFQYLLQVLSVMMVGHLDELSLAGASIATSFTAVTGFSALVGIAGALETLCGQAYGAEQYPKLGIYTYCSVICMVIVCVPISILWIFTDKIMILIGQDQAISHVARKYSLHLIPSLFASAILQSFIRYFQAQSLILPMLLTSFTSLCIHVPLCWALVFKAKLGNMGAALAMGIAYWLNVVWLGLYMKYSSKCERTRVQFSKDVFLSMREFLGFAVLSTAMVCLSWWSYEVIILLSGLLPNPKLETSVLSICFTMTYLHYYVVYGIGATASVLVSNELGADNPRAAKNAVLAVMILAIIEVVIVSVIVIACRGVLGSLFSSEKEIVDHVAHMAPFICLCMIMDTLQAVLNGIVRGCGWQRMGVFVNLGAYYLIGIPVAAILAFVVHLRGKGLLIGLASGSFVQATLLGLKILSTNWRKQASGIRERIMRENPMADGTNEQVQDIEG